MSPAEIQDVVIVGGGYTGAAAAIHLSRLSTRSLALTVIEPRGEPGRGVAYDTDQPEHRLNVNPEIMILYLDDIDHFPRHLRTIGQIEKDPAARTLDGMVYVRRSAFGLCGGRGYEPPGGQSVRIVDQTPAGLCGIAGRGR